jgi:hypothetical protein
MAGRIVAGILMVYCLLLPRTLFAQGEDAAGHAPPVAPQGQALERRVEELEKAKTAYEEATRELERLSQQVQEELERARSAREDAAREQQELERRVEELETTKVVHEDATFGEETERTTAVREDATGKQDDLERRVEELETAKVAHEDATRSIIRQTFSEWGSRINEFVVLGGTFEMLAGWVQDFEEPSENVLRLDTFEFDFEVRVNDWVQGSLVVEYVDGLDLLFPSDGEDQFGLDRINLDTAFLTVGDTTRFPPFGLFGRMIVPFGISTGDPVADVLSIADPLTVEAFETREDAMLVGIAFPTPPLARPTPMPAPPPVKPLVLNPLVSAISRSLGYKPFPTPPPERAFVTPSPALPPFNAGVYFYNGDTRDQASQGRWSPSEHIGATVGYRTRRGCSYFFCPWSIDLDVDYNRSVFDSQFLEFEYRPFLGEIGFVNGMAGSLKANLGPVALVAEWNGAIEHTEFTDGPEGQGQSVSIMPHAWQVSLGYQFGWEPWVEEIGAQGTYVTAGYSESRDLGGVNGSEWNRVGFLPKRRFLVGAGEWILEGFRVAIEYSHDVDYPKSEGGTGRSANSVLSQLTYEW